MDPEYTKVKKGDRVQFTCGEYSDFRTIGCLRFKRAADLRELADKMRASHKPKDEWDDKAEPNEFPAWLVENGYAEDASVKEVHVGSYGDWEL